MKILLFDMDGVLLESRGYHLALQETIRRMAMALGFGKVTLSSDDIAVFEAGGITSEWDEAAICTALLMENAWKEEPGCGLPDSLALPFLKPPYRKTKPNFHELAQKLSTPNMLRFHSLERAAHFFLGINQHTAEQFQILHDLILEARMPETSLTHRTFQELVLGSVEFSHAYNLPAEMDCESYLLKYDHSNLSSSESAHLMDWISTSNHAAAVITSRPSHPPEGIFSTPEAELGAKLVGLEGIPILGWGGIYWLGLQRQINPQIFLKPSPVHVLAGLRLALGERQEASLLAAVDLVESGQAGSGWTQFDGAQVCIIEDSSSGIKSLHKAQQALEGLGIRIETNYIGIAQKLVKIQALRTNGALVFSSLPEVLDKVMV